MSEFKNQGDYLAQYGEKLIDNGYNIVPIQRGKKAPGFDGWQKSRSTKAQLKDWLAHGHKNSGVGIITKHTPAIDIDVLDDDIARRLGQWVSENICDTAPMRVGRAPKRLYLFRCEEPFRKITSNRYVDEWGEVHRIEILGDGQQFVAYHIHPDTQKPYIWPGFDGPLETQADDLPVLTVDKAMELISYFDELAAEAEWKILKRGRNIMLATKIGSMDDNPWLEDSDPVDMTPEELKSRLMLVPNAEDYDTWVQIGMSLYHQFDGEDIGREMWHEWSETADNYDGDALDRRWEDFNVQGKKRAPITARFILQLAKEAVESTAAEQMFKLRDAFLEAKDVSEWEKARKMTQQAEIDALSRSALATVAKDRRDSITGTKTPLSEIKKAIAYAPKQSEKIAKWATNWVYDTSDDRFFNTVSKIAVTKQGFDAMYDRQAMTKKDALEGRSSPSMVASDVALNIYKIPVVAGRRYMPGLDPIYRENDCLYANLYAEHEIPDRPEKLLPRDKRNIEIVKKHIEHLIVDPKERRMFIDWLSWVVQHPGKHMNYGVLLQGVQGDGKTFFAEMLRAVMGASNVNMLNAEILKDRFTDWTVGQCVNCVEEVRLINDTNKYEIINRIKPFITNNIIEVHPKGKSPFNAVNTTSYILFSNYKDALPLDDGDRRYMVLFSRWQRRQDIRKFKIENPDYYTNLYGVIEQSAGALRSWLLDHAQAPDFDPHGDAPDTFARSLMIHKAKPEMIQLLDELVANDETVGVSAELLEIDAFADALVAIGANAPPPKAMSAMLERYGWERIGRVRIDDRRPYVWSSVPENFVYRSAGVTYPDVQKVREHFRLRKERCTENAL